MLLTGATGFVGGAVRPALEAAGWKVRCLTRDVARASAREPEVAWVQGDLGDADSCARALAGCDAALYLVHGMGEGADYHEREVQAARKRARVGAVATVQMAFGDAPALAPAHVPAPEAAAFQVTLRLDAVQLARFEALLEAARKARVAPATADRVELVLAGLAALHRHARPTGRLHRRAG